MAIYFINVHFDSEETPIEHNNDNVYTDGEFNIKIPKNSSLVSMPNMTWTQVEIHTFYLTVFLGWSLKQCITGLYSVF
jgi:hypothetical protein